MVSKISNRPSPGRRENEQDLSVTMIRRLGLANLGERRPNQIPWLAWPTFFIASTSRVLRFRKFFRYEDRCKCDRVQHRQRHFALSVIDDWLVSTTSTPLKNLLKVRVLDQSFLAHIMAFVAG